MDEIERAQLREQQDRDAAIAAAAHTEPVLPACVSATSLAQMAIQPAKTPRCAVVCDAKLTRLHRRLMARDCAQVVFRQPNDRLDLMPASSPRFLAMLRDARWVSRVIGVFYPSVSFDVLREEVR